MSAQEAISMIKDGDKIGVGGFIGMGHPQELSVAIEKSFLETGHPRDLTVMFSAGVGDGTPDLGLNHMGHKYPFLFQLHKVLRLTQSIFAVSLTVKYSSSDFILEAKTSLIVCFII